MNEKLIRDRVPEVARARGAELNVRKAAFQEVAELLVAKLEEEAAEVSIAETPAELLAELADVLEVVHTLATLNGWSRSDLERAQAHKNAQYGSFSHCYVMTLD